ENLRIISSVTMGGCSAGAAGRAGIRTMSGALGGVCGPAGSWAMSGTAKTPPTAAVRRNVRFRMYLGITVPSFTSIVQTPLSYYIRRRSSEAIFVATLNFHAPALV